MFSQATEFAVPPAVFEQLASARKARGLGLGLHEQFQANPALSDSVAKAIGAQGAFAATRGAIEAAKLRERNATPHGEPGCGSAAPLEA